MSTPLSNTGSSKVDSAIPTPYEAKVKPSDTEATNKISKGEINAPKKSAKGSVLTKGLNFISKTWVGNSDLSQKLALGGAAKSVEKALEQNKEGTLALPETKTGTKDEHTASLDQLVKNEQAIQADLRGQRAEGIVAEHAQKGISVAKEILEAGFFFESEEDTSSDTLKPPPTMEKSGSSSDIHNENNDKK